MKPSMLRHLFAGLCLVSAASARPLFLDNYDNDIAGESLPAGYTAFGAYASLGVSQAPGAFVSAPAGAFLTFDFTQTESWGAGLAHYLDHPVDLTGATLSVKINANKDLSAKPGFIGFRLADADGTVVRTPTDALFSATTAFATVTQAVSSLTFVDEPGRIPGLDLKAIVSIGLLFYDRGDIEETVVFNFDDLAAGKK